MVLLRRRATLVLCAAAVAGFAGAASAKPAHKTGHKSAHASQATRVAQTRPQGRDVGGIHERLIPAGKAANATQGRRQARAKGHRGRATATEQAAFSGFSTNSLVAEARRYIGTNPTGRRSLWCGAFMDFVLRHTGHTGGGNLASAYAHYGTRISGPQVGAIAVMHRRGGGHVGVVSGIDPNGNPIIISGNHNHTTAEAVYPRSRIYAYVLPNG
ncbi:MAG: TIGR02594 family protein [Rhodopseudomonas sp.]|nr:TIGR02594 family protein [Rhodopseudomonas sp.]